MTAVYTSRSAYFHLRQSGKENTQKAVVLRCVLRHAAVGITRRAIASATGLELGAVAGRVNGLIEDKLLREEGEAECPVSKRTVKLVWPVEGPRQASLL